MTHNRDNYDNYRPEIPFEEELPPANEIDRRIEKRENGEQPKTRRNKKNVSKPAQKGNKTEHKKIENEVSWFKKLQTVLTGQSARLIVGIFLGCLCIYLGVAFISYFSSCISDQSAINTHAIGTAPDIANTAGEGGARLAEFLINETFGLGSFVIVIWFGAIALKLLVGRPRFKTVNFTIKCLVALITVSLIVGLTTISMHSSVNWGGYHGRYVNEFIMHMVGGIGALLLCVFMIALFVIICLRDLVLWIMKIKRKRDEKRRLIAQEKAERLAREEEMRKMQEEEKIEDIKAGEIVAIGQENIPEDIDNPVDFGNAEGPLYSLENEEMPEFGGKSDDPGNSGLMQRESGPEVDSHQENEENSSAHESEESTPDPSSDSESESENEAENTEKSTSSDGKGEDPMVVTVNQIDEAGKTHYRVGDSPADNYPYKFPPCEILREGVEKISVDAEEQMENKEKIKSTLLDFGIPITKIQATVGPTVTLYEIVPDKGVKIAKIRSLVDDIALSLAAKGVRIIAPIPGKGTVGIEVANKDPQMVSMRTIIKSKKYQESKYILPMAIGSTISNDVYIADLAKMPHLLVAGATGQGKSVGLNAIIASLLYCKRPNELKFVMIDPKQVEFSLYNKIKDHYMAAIPTDNSEEEPVITDMQKVEATLNSLCIEMDNRYNLLKNAHTRNIEEYNNKYKEGKLNPAEGHRFLPYIVVVVDEFGDLIMVSGKNVEMPIARLAQKARAVGMHVIIATQRPSTNVITGIIKANFPARISFKVSSGVDSKTILDTPGAQQLIGRGDMLIFNNSEMVRVQCAFIDTPEVESICDYVEEQPYAQGVYLLPEPVMGDSDGDPGAVGTFGELDPLFEEVARMVVTSNTASTSSLQRRYSIGYNRAGKIMDQLEAHGIVGPSQGGKPRAVLVDPIGLENILSSLV